MMRASWKAFAVVGFVLSACAVEGADATGESDDAVVATPPAETTPVGPARAAPLPVPKLQSYVERCKLINNLGVDDPTLNRTHYRGNVKGTDLGIPVVHEGTLFFFFGDTVGYKGIWNFGEGSPDSVAHANALAVARDPATLCSTLGWVTLPPGDSIGPKRDRAIEADFAGVFMRPPPGRPIGDFIHNPAGRGAFPNLPGDFEVPSGAFSYKGSIYIFYTTVVSRTDLAMKGSYLAKWQKPSTSGVPAYDILYSVDQRFDANGPLRGDFINMAALVVGDYVYLYGSGDYRRSQIHLARKRLATIEEPGGYERYDPATKTWKVGNLPTPPVVEQSGNGEVSVRYFPEIGRYMMISQVELPGKNLIMARFATAPEGPWSDVLLHDMADPVFRDKYCCNGNQCQGERLFHCDRAGFYGTYLLPDVKVLPDKKFTVTYLMSTWDPYNVALMQSTFE